MVQSTHANLLNELEKHINTLTTINNQYDKNDLSVIDRKSVDKANDIIHHFSEALIEERLTADDACANTRSILTQLEQLKGRFTIEITLYIVNILNWGEKNLNPEVTEKLPSIYIENTTLSSAEQLIDHIMAIQDCIRLGEVLSQSTPQHTHYHDAITPKFHRICNFTSYHIKWHLKETIVRFAKLNDKLNKTSRKLFEIGKHVNFYQNFQTLFDQWQYFINQVKQDDEIGKIWPIMHHHTITITTELNKSTSIVYHDIKDYIDDLQQDLIRSQPNNEKVDKQCFALLDRVKMLCNIPPQSLTTKSLLQVMIQDMKNQVHNWKLVKEKKSTNKRILNTDSTDFFRNKLFFNSIPQFRYDRLQTWIIQLIHIMDNMAQESPSLLNPDIEQTVMPTNRT